MSARKSSYIFEYRFTVLGGPQVGKSAIISQLVFGEFIEKYEPTSENHVTHVVKHNDAMCVCLLVDTAGRDDFPAMRRLSITKSNAFIVVYSIDNKKSFENAKQMVELIKRLKKDKNIKIILVGNKIDLASERVISFQEASSYSNNISEENVTSLFREVTAKENDGVKHILTDLLDAFNPAPPLEEHPVHEDRKFSFSHSRMRSRLSSKGLIQRKASLPIRNALSKVASISDSSIEKISNMSPKLPFRRIRLRSDSHPVVKEAEQFSKIHIDSPLISRHRTTSIGTAISSPILMCHSINLKRQKLQSVTFQSIDSVSSEDEESDVCCSPELERRSRFYTPQLSPLVKGKFTENRRPELRRFASCPATNEGNFDRSKKSRASLSAKMKQLFRRAKSSTP